jgi:Ankyrin repeats (3 copies)
MIHAAESGHTAAIALMLDLGFPVDARGDDGGTPLHAAAYSGSAPVGRLLLDRGAGVEARDTTWDSTPMEWAAIGSGEQPASHPHPTGPAPCKPCSTRAPQPGTSPCHR